MDFYALTGLVNGIFALGFGLFVIAKDRRNPVNQLFFALTLAVAFWALAYWRWLSSSDAAVALFWVRVLSIGSLFIPTFYFHWITWLLGITKRERTLIAVSYLLSFVLLLAAPTSFFIRGVTPKLSFAFWPEPGILYHLYILAYVGLVLYAIARLLMTYRTADQVLRGQIFYVTLGTVFGFGGGATNFLLWYDIFIPPYGNVLVAFFPFFLGYAILKHHLFDIRVIATELLVFAIWTFLLVRTLLADTVQERLLDAGLLSLVVVFGILLIRSVLTEVRSRERIAELAQKLAASNEELKRLDAAKSEFISIAGHQLRAPLTVIKGYVSMLLEGSLGAVGEAAREAMGKVAISAEQLIKLIADLLDLSRIEAGRLRYDFKPVELDATIEEVVGEFETQAKAQGLGFTFEKTPGASFRVKADPDKIREAVVNLIDNAIKYTSSGSVSVKLHRERRGEGERLVLTVTDTGIGIDPGDLGRMFTKFARTDEARRVRTEGMGLGLYIAKRIVEDHGGRVWVRSPGLGKGSTFGMELPAA